MSLIQAVDGMTPGDPEIHDTFLDLEPYTGAAMAAHKRIQVLKLKPSFNHNYRFLLFGKSF